MIDLHMHSNYSEDGEYSPSELAAMCARQGIRVMAVTDHNSVRANEAAMAAAKACKIRCLSGGEIDCTFSGVALHVLGYGIDPQSTDFARIEQNIRAQSALASQARLAKTRALGFRLTEAELQAQCSNPFWKESWSGELIGEVLLAKPEYREHPLLLPYRSGGKRSSNPLVNFYWDLYAPGKPCYVKMQYPSLEEVLDIIHRNGGYAVLAHPGVNLKGKEALLSSLLPLGFDGVEAFSSYHSPAQAAFFFRQAQEAGLFSTCGSDFHGKTKPAVRLASYPLPPADYQLPF